MPAPKFPELEEKMLALWDKEKLFAKTLDKTKNGAPFVFFEGPPTANGKPGLHHVIARAFKDAVPRWQTMRGRRVDRRAGWDTHGLPVELQVEKALEISGKPQIESLVPGNARASIIKFNEECKKSVWTYLEDWKKLTRRMGYWLDLDAPYITYENKYIESLWSILKKVEERGLLYQGHKVVPHCPRCGTALSSHEVAQGYKKVTDDSVFLKFKVGGQANTFLLSWTTTPWTLPGNVALAVGEKIKYEKARVGTEIFIMSAELAVGLLPADREILETIAGKDLVGWKYEPLFPFLADELPPAERAKAFQVYAADFVTTIDGTGIVHTAVMYGEDDYQLGMKVGLSAVHTVGEDGNFLALVKTWAGKFVKAPETEKEIIADLGARGLLLKVLSYEHDYPFCWRCDTPLLYYAKNSWFIKMSELSGELQKSNATINWVPAHIKEGRFGEWLRGVKDWAISRERYWGTPLPIWQCDKCKKYDVVISAAEIAAKSGAKLEDLHRPYVDDPTWACACGGTRARVKEVMDVWFDSGAMFVAQWGYKWGETGAVQKLFQEHFPADFISEGLDQTRGWFYTLLAVATLLELPAPYKNVICLGHILDAKGQKMSKSKDNVVDPQAMFFKYGADAVRWHLYSVSQAGEPKIFDEKGLDGVVKKVFLILWNVLEFYKMYTVAVPAELLSGTAESSSAAHKAASENSASPLDLWITNRLNQLNTFVTKNLEEYELTNATRAIEEFITDLSTWYVRRSRDRFKAGGTEAAAAVVTLRAVLTQVAQMMAPFAPMLADAVYREVNGAKESVHLSDWPAAGKVDDKVLQEMEMLRACVTQALEQRAKFGISVRQILGKLTVPKNLENLAPLFDILREEINVEEVVVGAEMILDTTMTPALKEKGWAREMIRFINSARKEARLKAGQAALASITCSPEMRAAAEKYAAEIKHATVCDLDFVSEGELAIIVK